MATRRPTGAARKTARQKSTTATHSANGSRPRRVAQGDRAPSLRPAGIEAFEVAEASDAATVSKVVAVSDIITAQAAHDIPSLVRSLDAIIQGASPEDAKLLKRVLVRGPSTSDDGLARSDQELSAEWRDGGYPYRNLLSRKAYEKQKYKLQVELLKLQAWVRSTGQKVVLLFEGRDAAGKG
ncbi:MAG: polyphosphate kinase 2, partial [Planctomycetaceae bacterium]